VRRLRVYPNDENANFSLTAYGIIDGRIADIIIALIKTKRSGNDGKASH